MANETSSSEVAADYADPVRQLLIFGAIGTTAEPERWPDYVMRLGLRPEHGPDLIRLACDRAAHAADHDTALLWAPVHAWRALGQLRVEAATEPLLEASKELWMDDDTAAGELPVVFGMIGPAALPFLSRFIRDQSGSEPPIWTAISGIANVGLRFPGCRHACIDILSDLLKRETRSSRIVNGHAVASLVDLKAVEAIEPIRDAFRRDAVDISFAGDLEDVEIELGLRLKRVTPKPNYHPHLAQLAARIAAPMEGVKASGKVGRNEPCPCGSGKKYKKCCLQFEAS